MSDTQELYDEQDRNAARASGRRHHPLVSRSIKTAIAAGVAYALGNALPHPVDQYAYYAPLGAVTVMYPAVADSILQALKAVAAIFVGAALAVLTMFITWPSGLSVAAVVGIGTAIAGLAWFGEQRAWLPLAALFVLTASEPRTEVYVIGYLSQIPLGAVVGIVANVLIFPSMSLYDLDHSLRAMRTRLIDQLRQMSDILQADGELDRQRWHDALQDLEGPRQEMQSLEMLARRARQGNVRSSRWSSVMEDLLELTGALKRCSFLVEDVGVTLSEFERGDDPLLGTELKRGAADVLSSLAELLAHPEETAPESERAVRAQAAADRLLDRVSDSQFSDRESRFLAGSVAVSAQRCIRTFARRHGVEDEEEAEQRGS